MLARESHGTNEVGSARAQATRPPRPVMMRGIAVGVALCLVLAAIPATAAEDDDAAALAALRPGQRVRAAAHGGDQIEGRLAALREGRLILDQTEGAAEIDAVQKVWVRRRDTKRGALIFGSLGAATAGTLLGLFVYAMGEQEDVPAGAAIGAAIGGAIGAGAGAIIGAASPRWDCVYSSEGNEPGRVSAATLFPAPSAAPRGDVIGSASVQLGLNKTFDAIAASGGPGGRMSVTMERGSLNPGLELGYYGLGNREIVTIRGEPVRYRESLFHIGPTLSYGPSHGNVRPYAIAGVGYYRWQSYNSTPHEAERGIDRNDPGITTLDELSPEMIDQIYDTWSPVQRHAFLGGSLGGGIKVQARKNLSLGAEARWHTNIGDGPWMSWEQRSRRLNLVTLTGGATIRW